MLSLDAKIESILFFKGESYSIKKIAEILKSTPSEIEEQLSVLENKLEERGISLVRKDGSVKLGTHPEMSEIIEDLQKEEINRDLTKAGLETLSIVVYRGPISRSDIDYIRGVNSQFILRNLLTRGLIERIQNPNDDRGYLYRPSFELLQFIGIKSKENMPEYESVNKEVEEFMKQKDNVNAENSDE